jgi:hypothetical protein
MVHQPRTLHPVPSPRQRGSQRIATAFSSVAYHLRVRSPVQQTVKQSRTSHTDFQAAFHHDPRRHTSFVPHQLLARAHTPGGNYAQHDAIVRGSTYHLHISRNPPAPIRFRQPSHDTMRHPRRDPQLHSRRNLGQFRPGRLLPRAVTPKLLVTLLLSPRNNVHLHLGQHHTVSGASSRARCQQTRSTPQLDLQTT